MQPLNDRAYPVLLLLAFVALEVLSQTYGCYWQLPGISSIIYALSGLGVAILPMFRWRILRPVSDKPWSKKLSIGLLLLLIAWCIWRTTLLLPANPLDYRQADMLPVLQTMAGRFLSGTGIYDPIPEIWEGMRPIYLPAMWLPFVPAVWLGIDIRWISALFLLMPAGLMFWGSSVRQSNSGVNIWKLAGLLPLGLLLYYIFGLYSTLLTLSEEAVVVGYYVLLAWGIFRKRPMIIGLAMALCLLSRYSLIFWVPMFLIYLWFFQSRQQALNTLASLVISALLFITIGQCWDQLGFFLQLPKLYLEELLDGSKNWSFAAQIENNPGLVKFMSFERIAIWHRLLLYGSILAPILCFFTFIKYRSILDDRFFGLCSLKLCLVFFYNFLTIPYSYLFYPSTFLSLFILFAAFSTKTSGQRNYLPGR